MAKKQSLADKYSNRTYSTLTLTAANTLSFQQIRFAAGLFQGIALVINKIKYYPSTATVREMVAATDYLAMAITTRNDVSDLDPTNLSVVDNQGIIGVGTNVEPIRTPIVSDFTNNPMGGLIVSANPLYLAGSTSGFVAAAVIYVVLEYQFVELSQVEAIELLQTMIPGSV